MKFKQIFWALFLINLILAIIFINILPFKSNGDKTGYMLSINLLYLFTYGVFVLYSRLAIAIVRRNALKKREHSGIIMVKIVLHTTPLLAFYAALNILIFTLPKAIADNDYMRLNSISMLMGLILGGTQSLIEIRKMNRKLENKNGDI
jgi:uncharacterized membrane protein YhaH (DUF805 family)